MQKRDRGPGWQLVPAAALWNIAYGIFRFLWALIPITAPWADVTALCVYGAGLIAGIVWCILRNRKAGRASRLRDWLSLAGLFICSLGVSFYQGESNTYYYHLSPIPLALGLVLTAVGVVLFFALSDKPSKN